MNPAPEPALTLPPAVIVHSAAQARAAVALGRPVTLLSAAGAGAYAGVMWWRALIAAAASATPPTDILDCGDATGRVLAALRGGQRCLVATVPPALFANLAARATLCGAVLLPQAPPALDLAAPGATRRLAAWLA